MQTASHVQGPPPSATQLHAATDSQVHTRLQVHTRSQVQRAPPKASCPVSLVMVAWERVTLPAALVFFGTVFGPETLREGSSGAMKTSGSGYS